MLLGLISAGSTSSELLKRQPQNSQVNQAVPWLNLKPYTRSCSFEGIALLMRVITVSSQPVFPMVEPFFLKSLQNRPFYPLMLHSTPLLPRPCLCNALHSNINKVYLDVFPLILPLLLPLIWPLAWPLTLPLGFSAGVFGVLLPLIPLVD